jgi:Domain of unknown function (DUF4411)
MLYLLDANVIITAKDSYYAIDQVPEFWEWLIHHAEAGRIKMPSEILDEVNPGNDKNDPFYEWRRDKANVDALLLVEDVDQALLQRVFEEGYAPDLTDHEVEVIGRDPFLVAYAMANAQRTVVTTEVSRPGKLRQNRKIPDVCDHFGTRWINPFELNRELGFRTQWKRVGPLTARALDRFPGSAAPPLGAGVWQRGQTPFPRFRMRSTPPRSRPGR